MKTTTCILTIILTSVFVFQFSSISASSDGISVSPKKEFSISVAPSTPKEALFEEETDRNSDLVNLSGLAPVTPKEATFEDDTVTNLSPVVPSEAGFEDLD